MDILVSCSAWSESLDKECVQTDEKETEGGDGVCVLFVLGEICNGRMRNRYLLLHGSC